MKAILKYEKIKVSVIVPVYNVEKYLKEAMDSIVNQTLKEIEIICVDDGSTDNSSAILKEYAEKDDRIIMLEQENRGAGAARNAGLDVAHGEYLSFLDPDDFFELTLLEEFYKKAISCDADIVVCGSNSYDDQRKRFSNLVGGRNNGINYDNLPESDIFSYENIKESIFDTFGATPWNKFFKLSFISEQKIKFQNLFRTNDAYFVCAALGTANRIVLLDRILVYYRTKMKTNSQSTNHMYPLNFYEANLAIKNKLENLSHYNKLEYAIILRILEISRYNLNSQKTLEGFKIVYEHLVDNLDKDFSILEHEEYILEQNKNIVNAYNDYKLMLKTPVDEYLALKGRSFIDEEDTSIRVSVIIPVYNTEKYLKECLDSIVNQTLENIEIICINDGSTDNSIDILREYANKDNRFTIISQKNQGLSATRNNGIKVARGSYIYFMDSDDKLELYSLDLLFNEAVTNDLDVIYFDGSPFYESIELEKKYPQYKTLYQSKFKENKVLCGTELFKLMIDKNSYRVQACLYMIKTEFLVYKQILFPVGIFHEDNSFMFELTLSASRTKHLKEQLFLRRVRENSIITQSITFNHFYGYLICHKEMIHYTNDFSFSEDTGNAINRVLNDTCRWGVKEYNALSKAEKDKIKTLSPLEQYYFDTVFAPKLQVKPITQSNHEIEKYKKEATKYKNECSLIRQSATYKIGRFFTFFPRKIRGGIRCYKDNGFKYTLRRIKVKLVGKG